MSTNAIISCDDHMDLHTLPLDLWEKRLPKEFREIGPRVEETDRGRFWVCEGERWGRAQPAKIRGLPSVFERVGIEEWITRPSTTHTRLEDMNRDGIQASVIYTGPGGFPVKDPILKYHVLRAYNEWTAEFNGASPNRLCNLATIPAHDPEAAAGEVRRAVKMGHRGGLIDHFGMTPPIYDPVWEPLWDAAEETGMSISTHLGGGTYMLPRKIGSWVMAARVCCVSMQLDEVLSSMCFSGVLERHPKLNLILGESGLGWVPFVLERMDEVYVEFAPNTRDYWVKTHPRELFDRQMYVTFQEEKLGVELIPLIGAGSVMWASDYPHPDSTWPDSVGAIEAKLGGLSEDDRRKITCENAAGVYGFDQEKSQSP